MKNLKAVKWGSVLLPVACLLPFLILCFYCFPAVDDFSFANITDDYGYVGAQIHWYTTWTGRYFSTAILSTAPVVIRFFSLYHLWALLMFLASFHSLYFLVRSLSPRVGRFESIALALIAFVAYLLYIPDITQAFYWFSGSATYQLASALLAYTIGYSLRCEAGATSARQWMILAIPVFAIVGSNEVAMMITALLVGGYYAISLFAGHRVFNPRLWVVFSAVLGSALLVFAPGNSTRAEGDIAERSSDQVLESLSLAYAEASFAIGEWFWMPFIPLVLLSALGFGGPTPGRVRWLSALAVLALTGVFILAVYFPTFYLYKIPPPQRTQNFGFWITVIGAVSIGRLLSPLFFAKRPFARQWPIHFGVIAFLILALALPNPNNADRAFADLRTGSAKTHKTEYENRRDLLAECTAAVCEVPSYTAFPFTTFVSDSDSDPRDWWNIQYAGYNHNGRPFSVDYSNQLPVFSHTMHFHPSEIYKDHYDLGNLDDSIVYAGSHSYHMAADVQFGAGREFVPDTLNVPLERQIAYLGVEAFAYFPDTLRDLHIVFVLVREGLERPYHWSSTTWEEAEQMADGWYRTADRVPLHSLGFRRSDVFQIYLWNPEGRDVHVDEFTVALY